MKINVDIEVEFFLRRDAIGRRRRRRREKIGSVIGFTFGVLTFLERELDGVWVESAEVRVEGLCVLDVDGEAGAEDGVEGVEADEADGRRC